SCLTIGLNPAALIVPTPSATVKPRTSGIGAVCGPRETTSVTCEPRGSEAPGFGFASMTVPFGLVESASCCDTLKPSCSSSDCASEAFLPITSEGTITGGRPLETLIRTVVPFTTIVPGAGDCPVTVPVGLLDVTS